MNRIGYFAPSSIMEAVELLGVNERLRVIAGGTDLIVKWKKSRFQDMDIMDIRNIQELYEIKRFQEHLFIGAGLSMSSINESDSVLDGYPILAEAAGSVGSVQIRNMATIGGNVCNAAPSADTVLPLIVYRAEAVIVSKSGERSMPIEDFFVGPGKTIIKQGEMLKGLRIPNPPPRSAGHFMKHSRRAGMDLATVGVGMLLTLGENDTVKDLRIALGAVGPVPILVKKMPPIVGKSILDKEIKELVVSAALLEASPISDVRGSKRYREEMIRENVAVCFAESIKSLNTAKRM